MSTRDTIIEKLSAAFAPVHLEVIDESERHRGHSGWREGGRPTSESKIATRQFAGKPRLVQHRAVMSALDLELKTGVHALAVEVLPPDGPVSTSAGT